MEITVQELLRSGLLSQAQPVYFYNCDAPMGRVKKTEEGNEIQTHYFLQKLPYCAEPNHYIYEMENGKRKEVPVLDENGKFIYLKNSFGEISYKKKNDKFILDKNGNKIPIIKTEPIIIGETKQWEMYKLYKDCKVAYIYADFLKFKKNNEGVTVPEDTGLIIQVHAGLL